MCVGVVVQHRDGQKLQHGPDAINLTKYGSDTLRLVVDRTHSNLANRVLLKVKQKRKNIGTIVDKENIPIFAFL